MTNGQNSHHPRHNRAPTNPNAGPCLNEFITNELKRYPHPSNITLELIETQAIANYSEVKAFISMVKSKGVKVIIDDFGSGYSNISNVLKLEVDGIKLDGGLIKQIIHDNDIYLFIEHIAAFANQLDLLLIAESVENAAIVNALENSDFFFSMLSISSRRIHFLSLSF